MAICIGLSIIASSTWIERLSLIELILMLTSIEELSIVIPGEGHPVTASAYDLKRDILLVLPAVLDSTIGDNGVVICLHI